MSHPLRQLYRVLLLQITCISHRRLITVATLTQWQQPEMTLERHLTCLTDGGNDRAKARARQRD